MKVPMIPVLSYVQDIEPSIVAEYAACLNSSVPVPVDEIVDILASKSERDPDYMLLSGRIVIMGLHEWIVKNFDSITDWFERNDRLNPSLRDGIVANLRGNGKHDWSDMSSNILWKNDLTYERFAVETFKKSYATTNSDGHVIDSPQLFLLRVTIGILGDDVPLSEIVYLYTQLSNKKFTFATPTLFNAGHIKPQLASCFLMPIMSDSMEGIMTTVAECAIVSKHAGGIGLSVQNVRSANAIIRGTGGKSKGIIPMLAVFAAVAEYSDQGGKRPGSTAVYTEPHHPDFLDTIQIRRGAGTNDARARTLFCAAWLSDLFMERVRDKKMWTFMDPDAHPGLEDCYGDEYRKLYLEYESQYYDGISSMSQEPADKIFLKILDTCIETGTPYILFKDACNRKSNQSHIGTIRSSNLCAEIIEFSGVPTSRSDTFPKSEDYPQIRDLYAARNDWWKNPDNKRWIEDNYEVAVCNLSSICLNKFVDADGKFLFDDLRKMAYDITKWLDTVIDINMYPVEAARRSNLNNRPIGIGVQAYADVMAMMSIDYDSSESIELTALIAENIYLGAVQASVDMAEQKGAFPTYAGSKTSEGLLQFDLWNVTPTMTDEWNAVKEKMGKHGIRNSLLVAYMPTASTAHLNGNHETMEPPFRMIFTRRTTSGTFTTVNRHLVNHLKQHDLWTPDMVHRILDNNGSIQTLTDIPESVRKVFKTVFDVKASSMTKHASARGPYIDQSSSQNVYFSTPHVRNVSSLIFDSWKRGLKTAIYYLRSELVSESHGINRVNTHIETTETVVQEQVSMECSDDVCISCGS